MKIQNIQMRTGVLKPSGQFLISMSGLVLTPIAVSAGVLGAWRFGADPGWTSDFFISKGLFSRYQLWFAVAVGALVLDRWIRTHKLDSLEVQQ